MDIRRRAEDRARLLSPSATRGLATAPAMRHRRYRSRRLVCGVRRGRRVAAHAGEGAPAGTIAREHRRRVLSSRGEGRVAIRRARRSRTRPAMRWSASSISSDSCGAGVLACTGCSCVCGCRRGRPCHNVQAGTPASQGVGDKEHQSKAEHTRSLPRPLMMRRSFRSLRRVCVQSTEPPSTRLTSWPSVVRASMRNARSR